MIVQKTSVFPAPRDVVFQKLQRLETLRAIASPYAAFEPVDSTADVWTVGGKSSYRLRLFGFILFGTHTIRIVRFDPEKVNSREGNGHVPVWNHDILLVPVDESHTEYTDRVELRAGWKNNLHLAVGKGVLCPQAEEMDQAAERRRSTMKEKDLPIDRARHAVYTKKAKK